MAQELADAYREETERALIGLPNRQAIVRRRTDPAHDARPGCCGRHFWTSRQRGEVSAFKASALARHGKGIAEIEKEISERWTRLGIRLGRREQPRTPPQVDQQLKEVG